MTRHLENELLEKQGRRFDVLIRERKNSFVSFSSLTSPRSTSDSNGSPVLIEVRENSPSPPSSPSHELEIITRRDTENEDETNEDESLSSTPLFTPILTPSILSPISTPLSTPNRNRKSYFSLPGDTEYTDSDVEID